MDEAYLGITDLEPHCARPWQVHPPELRAIKAVAVTVWGVIGIFVQEGWREALFEPVLQCHNYEPTYKGEK